MDIRLSALVPSPVCCIHSMYLIPCALQLEIVLILGFLKGPQLLEKVTNFRKIVVEISACCPKKNFSQLIVCCNSLQCRHPL